MASANAIEMQILIVLGLYALIPLAAIILGLLIFFLGRRPGAAARAAEIRWEIIFFTISH